MVDPLGLGSKLSYTLDQRLLSGIHTTRDKNYLNASLNYPNFDVFADRHTFRLVPERPEQFRTKVKGVVNPSKYLKINQTRNSSLGRTNRTHSIHDMSLLSGRSSLFSSMTDNSLNMSEVSITNFTQTARKKKKLLSRRRKADQSPHRSANYYKNLVSSEFLKPKRPHQSGNRHLETILFPQDSGKGPKVIIYPSQPRRQRKSGRREPMNTPVGKSLKNTPGTMTPYSDSREELSMITREGIPQRKWR